LGRRGPSPDQGGPPGPPRPPPPGPPRPQPESPSPSSLGSRLRARRAASTTTPMGMIRTVTMLKMLASVRPLAAVARWTPAAVACRFARWSACITPASVHPAAGDRMPLRDGADRSALSPWCEAKVRQRESGGPAIETAGRIRHRYAAAGRRRYSTATRGRMSRALIRIEYLIRFPRESPSRQLHLELARTRFGVVEHATPRACE